jgi:hypothetical protein
MGCPIVREPNICDDVVGPPNWAHAVPDVAKVAAKKPMIQGVNMRIAQPPVGRIPFIVSEYLAAANLAVAWKGNFLG